MLKSLSLDVSGMSCGHCVTAVERVLKGLPEVEAATVAVGSAMIALSPNVAPAVAATAVTSALAKAGYDSSVRETALTSLGARSSCCCGTRPSTSAPALGAAIAALEQQEYESLVEAAAESAGGQAIRSYHVTDLTSADATN